MKSLIWIGITVGGTLGGWLGSLLDHGSLLGAWGIIGSALGSIAGLWVGYKIAHAYL